MDIEAIIGRRLDCYRYLRNGDIGPVTFLLFSLLPKPIRPLSVDKKFALARAGHIGVYPDDTFLISYPHSGRTWLTCLLANLKQPGSDWNARNYIVPGYMNYELMKKVEHIQRPRVFAIHNLGIYGPYCSKVIYLYRDGRDVAASLYKTFRKKHGFESDFGEFLRMYVKDGFNGSPAWHNHVAQYLFKPLDKALLPVRYEDLCQSPVEVLQEICAFVGLEANEDLVQNALQQCSFRSYQKATNSLGAKGKPGKWREFFNDKLLQFYLDVAGETLEKLGYLY